MPVFRLLTVIEGVSTIERRLEAALVGRERELAELRRALDAVRGERRCRVVTVLGEAGIGKTRLVGELLAEAADDTTVLIGRCVSYGEGSTYLPLAEMLSRIGDDLDAVLAAAASTGEELLAIRRYFESLARRRPLVLVFEDIHWAEPTLLDVIEHLRGQVSGVPLLVLCLARTELLVERPGWPDALQLLPLPDRQTLSLLEAAAGGVEPERPFADRRDRRGQSALRGAASRVRGGGRRDRCCAAVDRGAARESVRPARSTRARPSSGARRWPGGSSGEPRCWSFRRRTRFRSWTDTSRSSRVRASSVPSAGDGLRFHHVLIRDVAYAGIPKTERVELHERLADWLDSQPEGTDQVVGYHLEQASSYSSELEPGNRRARRLAADAGACLGRAGIRAWKRGDTPAAMNLLGRAAELLAKGDSFRLALLCELGVALRGAGELDRAADMLVETADTAATAGDRRAHLRARLELANVRMFADPGGRADELLDVAAEAIPVFEAVDDDHSLSRAWRLIGFVQGAMRCRYAAAVDATERALDHARRSGWSTAASTGDLAAALYHGPTPVPEAISRCHELLEDADLGGRAGVLVHLGGLEATLGHFDEARRLVDRGNELYRDLGQTALAHGNCGTMRGQIELLAGDAIAAEQAFRTSYEALESIGDRADLATRAAELAEAVLLNGRRDESERWSRVAEQFGSSDDVPTQFLWRAVRSKTARRKRRPRRGSGTRRGGGAHRRRDGRPEPAREGHARPGRSSLPIRPPRRRPPRDRGGAPFLRAEGQPGRSRAGSDPACGARVARRTAKNAKSPLGLFAFLRPRLAVFQARGPPPEFGMKAVIARTSFRRPTSRPGANGAPSAGQPATNRCAQLLLGCDPGEPPHRRDERDGDARRGV